MRGYLVCQTVVSGCRHVELNTEPDTCPDTCGWGVILVLQSESLAGQVSPPLCHYEAEIRIVQVSTNKTSVFSSVI